MSAQLTYRIKLLADAEPGSGFGSNSVNQYVTRDGAGQPVITSSHIKGLVRQCLTDIFNRLGWDMSHLDHLLGAPGWRPAPGGHSEQAHHGGVESACRFHNAYLTNSAANHTRLVTRTAIDPDTGTVVNQSLRTAEAVCAGTTFSGRIHCRQGDRQLLALGLTAIGALGGGRNRGSGACSITVDGINEPPGQLLRALAPDMARAPAPTGAPAEAPILAASGTSAGSIFFDLVFQADGPVLCPDLPEAHNLLRSGLSIPASAVHGAILHLINRTSPKLADACFRSPHFRAWPLQPEPEDADPLQGPPVRVSITHRSAKLISDPVLESDFFDEALDRWEDRPPDAPALKSSDGVLIPKRDGKVLLWRANDVPRLFSTHGVHSDGSTKGGRNLYSVEAINASSWRGILAVPAEFAAPLGDILKSCSVSFGKGRSVRGGGTLKAHQCEPTPVWLKAPHGLFIAQSPILLPPSDADGSVLQRALKKIADQWAAAYHLGTVEHVWATQGLRFGWNRHHIGDVTHYGRLHAARVALPGAVIKLDREPRSTDLLAALIGGIGDGRDRGFGCLLPHPGKASNIYRRTFKLPDVASNDRDDIKRGIELASKSQLSSSQISAVLEELGVTPAKAQKFLDSQKSRGTRFWSDWQDSYKDLKEIIHQPNARKILSVARDYLQMKSSTNKEHST